MIKAEEKAPIPKEKIVKTEEKELAKIKKIETPPREEGEKVAEEAKGIGFFKPTTKLILAIIVLIVLEFVILMIPWGSMLTILIIMGLAAGFYYVGVIQTITQSFEPVATTVYFKNKYYGDWIVSERKYRELIPGQQEEYLKTFKREEIPEYFSVRKGLNSIIIGDGYERAPSPRFGGDLFKIRHKVFHATQKERMITTIKGKDKEVDAFYCPFIKTNEDVMVISDWTERVEKAEEKAALFVSPEKFVSTLNDYRQLTKEMKEIVAQKYETSKILGATSRMKEEKIVVKVKKHWKQIIIWTLVALAMLYLYIT